MVLKIISELSRIKGGVGNNDALGLIDYLHNLFCFDLEIILPHINFELCVSLLDIIRYKERRWDTKKMLDSGGMPSSHSATVTALAFSIGLHDGTGGSTFAIALILACVVCTHSLTKPFFFSLSSTSTLIA